MKGVKGVKEMKGMTEMKRKRIEMGTWNSSRVFGILLGSSQIIMCETSSSGPKLKKARRNRRC